METKLNNNEVKEIAEMQRKIDSYEAFIMAISNTIMKPQVNFAIPLYEGISLEMEQRLSVICEFVKKHKNIRTLVIFINIRTLSN